MNIKNRNNLYSECKFCLEEDKQKHLISPCKCNGSLKYVHLKCLEKYHEKRYLEKCEICGDNFKYKIKVIKSKLYSLFSIYLICFLNNIFSSLLMFDLDFTMSILITVYIVTYYYLFIQNKLFEINLKKNKRVLNPDKYISLYCDLNKIYNVISIGIR